MKNVLSFDHFNEKLVQESLNEGFDNMMGKIKQFFIKHILNNFNGKNLIAKIDKEYGHLSIQERNEKARELASTFKNDSYNKSSKDAALITLLSMMLNYMDGDSFEFSEIPLTYFIVKIMLMCFDAVEKKLLVKNVRKYIKNTDESDKDLMDDYFFKKNK